MQKQHFFRFGDGIIIGIILVVAIGIWGIQGYQRSFSKNAIAYVTISVNGQQKQYDLQKKQTISITDTPYPMTIAITDGTVQVITASCPDKICRASGKIHKVGQIIACVPAKVFLQIEAAKENGTNADFIAG